jgi:hypothetical protein
MVAHPGPVGTMDSRGRMHSWAVVILALAALVGAAPAAGAPAVSGVVGDPPGSHITFTLSGADFWLKSGSTDTYEGTYTGSGPITISGTAHAVVPGGGEGTASAGASIGPLGSSAEWSWPADNAPFEYIQGSTSQTFSVSYTPTAADRAAGRVFGSARVNACAARCQGAGVTFDLQFARLTPAPIAKAWKIDEFLRIGKRYSQYLAVSDRTGKARIYTDLYDGGTNIGSAKSPGLVTAKGQKRRVLITPSANRKGPLEFCVWAMNASGATSAKAPRSACKWIDVVVPIKNVSNQCGGAGWDKVVQFQNWVGNTSSFSDSRLKKSYTVNFTDACNLHDAGYGGATVRDILDGKRGNRPIVNFRLWSRSEVDRKFLEDMRKICRREIPAKATGARSACVKGLGRYRAVRAVGGWFFDADLRKPGIQRSGHRRNDGPLDAIDWLP